MAKNVIYPHQWRGTGSDCLHNMAVQPHDRDSRRQASCLCAHKRQPHFSTELPTATVLLALLLDTPLQRLLLAYTLLALLRRRNPQRLLAIASKPAQSERNHPLDCPVRQLVCPKSDEGVASRKFGADCGSRSTHNQDLEVLREEGG